jgi:hypothetical protein
MCFDFMGKDYWKQLPSGHSQQQGGDSGVRQESPRQQEKPDVILPVINNRAVGKAHVPLYDRKEYERRVKAVLEGNILESTIRETADMLGQQIDLLNGVPLDVLRNNSNKLVNQDMDVAPLEEANRSAENTLHQVARNIHNSSLMKRYVEELMRKDREKWQLSEVDKAMMKGAEKACEVIEDKAEGHLIRLTSRMEWFPVVYHLVDKVALVVFTVLGYYTGKYHLNDTMVFLWLMAAMPIFIMSVIWGFNEVLAWVERRKKKPKLRA